MASTGTVTLKRKVVKKSIDEDLTVENRVKLLEEAKRHYFETGEPIMEDAEYDAEELIVAREAPSASVLKAVGAPPTEDVVQLPVPMPSLDKVKPDEPSWNRWLAKQSGEMLWSSKLDGVSALWIPSEGRLYNRGDGTYGSDISRFVPIIGGLVKGKRGGEPKMVRGEIIILREEAPKDAKLLRSWVNGVLHRKEGEALPRPGLLRFVAYKALEGKMGNQSMKEQFIALQETGYEVPPHGLFVINEKTKRDGIDKMMIELNQTQRAEGPYDVDGIVLTSATAKPEKPSKNNPKDTVAFKMSSEDQIAETTVKEIEWNLSRGGILIPRILIDPVTIGGATISKVTGHNAKFIVESGLGKGAKVNIRRSGDVIPIIDTVLKPVEANLPAKGTFIWDGVHIKPAEDEGGDPARKLLHSLKVLGVKGVGASLVGELVEGGYLTIFDINKADIKVLQSLIGTANGINLKEGVSVSIVGANLVTKILSYPELPAGLGASRIQAFVNAGSNFAGDVPEGFGEQTWAALTGARKGIEEWVSQFPAPVTTTVKSNKEVEYKGTVCLTGFRDAALKGRAEKRGWTIKDTFSKDCDYLIVPDLSFESTKTEQAKKYNIPILSRDVFVARVG